jgi:hypothetical protein
MVVSKKNKKLKIYVDFRKLNVVRKKDPYLLLLINKLLNIVARHDAYSFLDGYFGYCIQDNLCNRLGSLYLGIYVMWSERRSSYLLERISKTFKNDLDKFMKIFLDGFIIYNDMDTCLNKLRL